MARPPLNIWPLVTRPHEAPLPDDETGLRDAAALFAELVTPALADHLLAPVSPRMAGAAIEPGSVQRDRLFKKFILARKRHWARRLVEGGVDVVFIKGFANAHMLYPDPAVRAHGDLDVLVQEEDLSRVIALLTAHGFRFRPAPASPWGMISDASFVPFVSADGTCALDLHIRPDCYPAHRSLTASRLFAGSRCADLGGFEARVPSPEHALILCVTNAAKDKYDRPSVSKVIDAILLLQQNASVLDWDGIVGLARDGGYLRPAITFFALLDVLGLPMEDVPNALRRLPSGIRRSVFQGVVEDYRALFPQDVPLTVYLAREWLIGAEPRAAFHNLLIRMKGVVRPSGGIPEGGPVEDDVLVNCPPKAGLPAGIRAAIPFPPRALRSNAR